MKTMKEVYEECSQGGEYPDTVITTGDNLNEILGVNEYESRSLYIITRDAITLLSGPHWGELK